MSNIAEIAHRPREVAHIYFQLVKILHPTYEFTCPLAFDDYRDYAFDLDNCSICSYILENADKLRALPREELIAALYFFSPLCNKRECGGAGRRGRANHTIADHRNMPKWKRDANDAAAAKGDQLPHPPIHFRGFVTRKVRKLIRTTECPDDFERIVNEHYWAVRGEYNDAVDPFIKLLRQAEEAARVKEEERIASEKFEEEVRVYREERARVLEEERQKTDVLAKFLAKHQEPEPEPKYECKVEPFDPEKEIRQKLASKTEDELRILVQCYSALEAPNGKGKGKGKSALGPYEQWMLFIARQMLGEA